MPTQLRSADTLVAPAVAETLDDLDVGAGDAAAVRLVERYAAALDRAAAAEAHADKVLAAVRGTGDDDVEAAVSALKAKVSAVATLENVGPKLLAALESLGATPKARGELGKGGGARGGGKLEALRSRSA